MRALLAQTKVSYIGKAGEVLDEVMEATDYMWKAMIKKFHVMYAASI